MFESHGCFGKGDEYNMAPALFVTQLKVCDTKNVHCTVDFFNVGGLIVSIVIFDISQKYIVTYYTPFTVKTYCTEIHLHNTFLHQNSFTPQSFHTKKK